MGWAGCNSPLRNAPRQHAGPSTVLRACSLKGTGVVGGGGVLLAIRDDWEIGLVTKGQEYILAQITRGSCSAVVGSIYIPPGASKYRRDYALVLAEIQEHI